MVTEPDPPRSATETVRRDRGVSAVEVVFAVPVMLAFILVLVSFGQLVSGRSAVDGAARDAARAGSLERSAGAAAQAADRVARSQLDSVCAGQPTVETGRLVGGEPFTVTVSCEVRTFNLFGNLLHSQVRGTSVAPVDTYRRTEGS